VEAAALVLGLAAALAGLAGASDGGFGAAPVVFAALAALGFVTFAGPLFAPPLSALALVLAAGFFGEGWDDDMECEALLAECVDTIQPVYGRWRKSAGGRNEKAMPGRVKSILLFSQILGFACSRRVWWHGNAAPAGAPDFRFQIAEFRTTFFPPTMMTLTSRAAEELAHLLSSRAPSPRAGLRLAVRRGGCAGWQYEMKVAEAGPDDLVVESGAARLIVAADSIDRLRGCEIDYSDDLTDAGFKVLNPNAARSCGCGTSFETNDGDPGADAVPDGEACGNS
jgi:iron-sulfur cluster assembly accessory protein